MTNSPTQTDIASARTRIASARFNIAEKLQILLWNAALNSPKDMKALELMEEAQNLLLEQT